MVHQPPGQPDLQRPNVNSLRGNVYDRSDLRTPCSLLWYIICCCDGCCRGLTTLCNYIWTVPASKTAITGMMMLVSWHITSGTLSSSSRRCRSWTRQSPSRTGSTPSNVSTWNTWWHLAWTKWSSIVLRKPRVLVGVTNLIDTRKIIEHLGVESRQLNTHIQIPRNRSNGRVVRRSQLCGVPIRMPLRPCFFFFKSRSLMRKGQRQNVVI